MTKEEKLQKIKELSEVFGITLKTDKIQFQLHGKIAIDFLAASNAIANNDPEYDPKTFVYRGEPNVNLNSYIQKKYGDEVYESFKTLW